MDKPKMSGLAFAALLLELDEWWLDDQAAFCRQLHEIIDPELWREPKPSR